MLNILVDESYAFDFLSILDVKLNRHNDGCTQMYKDKVVQALEQQLGKELVGQILKSDEYRRCIDANDAMFNLVDAAKQDTVSAREVDYGNYARCEAKKALQLKFFGSSTSEVKTGYDQYRKEER